MSTGQKYQRLANCQAYGVIGNNHRSHIRILWLPEGHRWQFQKVLKHVADARCTAACAMVLKQLWNCAACARVLPLQCFGNLTRCSIMACAAMCRNRQKKPQSRLRAHRTPFYKCNVMRTSASSGRFFVLL
eukprot:scaffold100541_cov18-Prasinocladus_malaysianus.AAC.2